MRTKTYRTPLERIIREQGREVKWIARQLDVDGSTVYRWMYGERNLSEQNSQDLAALLGVLESDITPPTSNGTEAVAS